ncbi:hypothetical protein JTE90_020895 [Oedothorax gibbosus]|uniref:Uncharacterized protein n=1 Tax=Oedothorax gibbosus TaxID=931172 RepID=A0AAV6UAE6_9ARAC|nr:hypothetical protein JTE90_020895 [Oedothorax gibbosus]
MLTTRVFPGMPRWFGGPDWLTTMIFPGMHSFLEEFYVNWNSSMQDYHVFEKLFQLAKLPEFDIQKYRKDPLLILLLEASVNNFK